MLKIGKMNAGEIVTVDHSYGGYRMKVDYTVGQDIVQVTMYDLSLIKPLVWSTTMTKANAHEVVSDFEAHGYMDMPHYFFPIKKEEVEVEESAEDFDPYTLLMGQMA